MLGLLACWTSAPPRQPVAPPADVLARVELWRAVLRVKPATHGGPAELRTCDPPRCDGQLEALLRAQLELEAAGSDVSVLARVDIGEPLRTRLLARLEPTWAHRTPPVLVRDAVDAMNAGWEDLCDHDDDSPLQALLVVRALDGLAGDLANLAPDARDPWLYVDPTALASGVRCE
ncbi:MAG: hypothetical protein H6736_13295 [Alphaproteobacteria bacterium]|nr:hypothetical protein [Alphaproteobacteria bacterium]MCB9692779.1 hypothetical protein [Alphaproteobacteria bacterium]